MPNYLISGNAGFSFDEMFPPLPFNSNKHFVESKGGKDIWMMFWPGLDPIGDFGIPGGLIITTNNSDGTMPLDENGDAIHPTSNEYYLIRPLGNEIDGSATGRLQYPYSTGMAQRELEPGHLYPAANDAMGIEVRHWEDTTPGWEGWGWRAEIVYVAEQRPPNARAIGIYSDPECLNYLYTTGAFVLQDSDWQTDEEGNPVPVWATNNPAGRATPEQAPVHYALLFGSAQEGHYTLEPGEVGTLRNYWEKDQGAAQRAAFIAAIDTVPGIQARENSFNRVIFRWRNKETRLTWAQIINTPMNQIDAELRTHIIRVALEVGLTKAAQRP